MHRLGKKVHDRDANSVETTGNFVSIRVELSARVELGHHDFGRGPLLFLHHVHGNAAAVVDGNAAAVVDYRDRVINVYVHFHRVAVPGQSFVNRIVDYFIDQMMQSYLARGPDIHRRPLAHGIAPFEHCNR